MKPRARLINNVWRISWMHNGKPVNYSTFGTLDEAIANAANQMDSL